MPEEPKEAPVVIELTEEQKKAALAFWNSKKDNEKPSMTELTMSLFGSDYDGRSKEGRAVKAYFASLAIKPRAAQIYVPKERPPLSNVQKEYIATNASTMSASELARELFSNPNINNLSVEARIVNDYIKTIAPSSLPSSPDDVPDGNWKAPNTFERTLARVNRHLKMAPINKDKLTVTQTKGITSLMGYLNIFRLEQQISTYSTESDRNLFESVFIRYTFDKSDLTQEEVDQYIILANEAVKEKKIQARTETLENLLDGQSEKDDDDKTKIAMSLVEAIGKCQAEYSSCIKRQQDLVNSLKQKRSDRMSKLAEENASILNLIALWRAEKTRIDLIKLAQIRKDKVKTEIDRLSSMEDVRCRILGLTREEALNGT